MDVEQLVYIAAGEAKRADFVTLTPDGRGGYRHGPDARAMLHAVEIEWLGRACT